MPRDIVYACTFVAKEIEEYQYEHGCVGKRTCCLSEQLPFTAPTLVALLDRLRHHLGLELDDLFIPGDNPTDQATHVIGFNRLENAAGYPPSNHEMARWKQAKLTLWLADYTFLLEKRHVEPVPLREFDQAGLKTH